MVVRTKQVWASGADSEGLAMRQRDLTQSADSVSELHRHPPLMHPEIPLVMPPADRWSAIISRQNDSERKADAAGLNGLYGYAVIDVGGQRIGTVDCIWGWKDGPFFIGTMRSSFLDVVRVIPGEGSRVNQAQHAIYVVFSAETVKTAPRESIGAGLNCVQQHAMHDHYRGGCCFHG